MKRRIGIVLGLVVLALAACAAGPAGHSTEPAGPQYNSGDRMGGGGGGAGGGM